MGTANKTNVTLRSDKSSPLTREEMDGNFSELENVIDDSLVNEQRIDDPTFGLDRRVIYVDTIADLQALSTSRLVNGQGLKITTTGRAGDFVVRVGDFSAEVASDPQHGVWVPFDSDPAGESIVATRHYEGELLNTWFGVDSGANKEIEFQDFINYLSSTRETGLILNTVSFSQDILFKSNVTLRGAGENFSGALNPQGSARILFDGVAAGIGFVQHCQLDGLTVYGNGSDAETVFEFRNQYSNVLRNIRINQLATSLNENKTGVLYENGADTRFEFFESHGTTESPSKYAFRQTGGTCSIAFSDIERTDVGIHCEGGSITITDPYMERLGVYGIHKLPDSEMSISGGKLVQSGPVGLGILVEGDNFHLSGTQYYTATGATPYLVRFVNNVSDSSEIPRNISVSGIPPSLVMNDSTSYGPGPSVTSPTSDYDGEMFVHRASRALSVTDGSTTPFFNVFLSSTGGSHALAVRMTVWVVSGGHGKDFVEYATVITRAGGNAVAAPMVEVFRNTDNTSANWTVSLSASATSVSSSTVSLDVNLSLSGANNTGGSETVYASLSVEGPYSRYRLSNL